MDETFIKERIGQLVAESGKSEKKISRELGRSAGYIQSLTSGKSMPSVQMLLQICDYFDVPPDLFFDQNVRHPLAIRHIISYASQMNDENLEVLEEISRKLSNVKDSRPAHNRNK